jgi:hypothetical protein
MKKYQSVVIVGLVIGWSHLIAFTALIFIIIATVVYNVYQILERNFYL